MAGIPDEPEGGRRPSARGAAAGCWIMFYDLVHNAGTVRHRSHEVNIIVVMDRDQAKARGAVLRAFLAARLPVPGAGSVTALARKAGIQPTTATSWWTKGFVPDNTSLRLLADALGVELCDLVAAYEGSSGRTWVLSDPELEALIERAVERALRRFVDRRDAEAGSTPVSARDALPAAGRRRARSRSHLTSGRS